MKFISFISKWNKFISNEFPSSTLLKMNLTEVVLIKLPLFHLFKTATMLTLQSFHSASATMPAWVPAEEVCCCASWACSSVSESSHSGDLPTTPSSVFAIPNSWTACCALPSSCCSSAPGEMKYELTKCFGVHLDERKVQGHYYQLGMLLAAKDFKDLVNWIFTRLPLTLQGYHICCFSESKVTAVPLEIKWLERWDYHQFIICHQLQVGPWKEYKVIKK